MKQNHARAKLKRGEPSIGTWLTLPDTVAARLMARVGFDWLTVELEHTPIDFETAADSFALIAGNNCDERETVRRGFKVYGRVFEFDGEPVETNAGHESCRDGVRQS